jgi:threonine/homoserine/homoserine lactone efflux protein
MMLRCNLQSCERMAQRCSKAIFVYSVIEGLVVIHRPAGVSCGFCLFVVVLSVLSFVFASSYLLRLRRHRPLRAFRLHLSLRCAGLNCLFAVGLLSRSYQ